MNQNLFALFSGTLSNLKHKIILGLRYVTFEVLSGADMKV